MADDGFGLASFPFGGNAMLDEETEAVPGMFPPAESGSGNLVDLPLSPPPPQPPPFPQQSTVSFSMVPGMYSAHAGPPPQIRNRKTGRVSFSPPAGSAGVAEGKAAQEAERPNATPRPSVFRWLVTRWLAGWVLAWRFLGQGYRRCKTFVEERFFGEEDSFLGRCLRFANKNKKQLAGAAYCSIGSAVFLVAVLLLTADVTVSGHDLRFAGGRMDVVAWATNATSNFSMPSGDFTCSELREKVILRKPSDGPPGLQDPRNDGVQSSLLAVMAQSERVVAKDGGVAAPCACAPMFGLRRRHMTVLLNEQTPLHLFNVRLSDAETQEEKLAAPPLFSRVKENQRILFPERTESVHNVRAETVWLEYLSYDELKGGGCQAGRVRLSGNEAFCAQACLDLFEGVSVYEKKQRTSE